MPCDKCGKQNCNGKCGISPSVLQINNNNCTLFHRVDVPAAMGDEKVNPPKTGAYRNVLLYYEASGNSYLYSSDGIPTKLTGVVNDYEVLLNKPWINGVELIGHKTLADLGITSAISGAVEAERDARVAADNALSSRITANSNAITAETTARENADNALDTRVSSNSNAIANEAIARENGDDALSARIDDYEDALEGEEAARKAADIALGGRIDANTAAIASEITARQNADTALSNRINTNTNNIATNTNNIAANTSAITSNSNAIAAETTARQNADNALSSRITSNSNAIAAETTARQNADNALSSRIDSVAANLSAETTARENADAALDGRLTAVEATAGSAVQPEDIDKVVMTDISATSNASQAILNESKVNLRTGVTSSEQTTLPVASSTTTGVMNAATYNAVADNTNNINAILSGAVAISNLPASPSQSALTTAWQNETGLSSLINRASIYDVTNSKVWTYYANDNTWYATTSASTVTINTFTNNSEGTIKGSTADGQVFAENDGTGSVNGWDNLTTDVANAKNKLSGIQAGAEVNVQANWNESNSASDAYIQNKPTIGNATLTIQRNGATLDTFTANATTNKTIDISVPTKTSDLTNDSGYVIDDGEIICTETEDGFAQITNPSRRNVEAPLTNLYGNATQKTTTGKNLFGASQGSRTDNAVTSTIKDGVITLNGTTSGSGTIGIGNQEIHYTPEGGETYTFTIWLASGTATFDLPDDCGFYIRKPDGTSYATGAGLVMSKIRQYGYQSTTFTAPSATPMRFLISANKAGIAFNNVVLRVQVEKGSTMTDWEEYTAGASPNPSYPQDVNVVSGAQEVKIVGKNLFDWEDSNKSASQNYSSATLNEVLDNGVIITGNTTASAEHAFSRGWYMPTAGSIGTPYRVHLYQASTITVSADITLLELGNTAKMKIYVGNGSTNITSPVANQDITLGQKVRLSQTFDNIPAGDWFPIFTLNSNKVKIENMLIQFGSQATAYEPYHGQSYEINLGKNLCSQTTNTSNTVVRFDLYNNNWLTKNFTFSAIINVATNTNSLRLQNDEGYNRIIQTITASANTRVSYDITLTDADMEALKSPTAYFTLYVPGVVLQVSDAMFANGFGVPYAPYKTPLELAKIGNYQDRIYKNDGKWYIEKQVGKVVLDGTETWFKSGTTAIDRFGIATSYFGNITSMSAQSTFSDYFIYNSGAIYGTYHLSSQNVYFDYTPHGTTTVDAWKTWLSTHNTTVYYKLATPTDTEITDSELIEQLNHIYSLYGGQNNLWLIPSGGAQGEMELCASFSQLPIATTQRLGAIIPREGLSIDNYGHLDVIPATASTIGGVKVGTNLSITPDGVLSADAQQIDVDSALSASSENPVQNKVINTALNGKQNTLSAAQLDATNSGITAAKVLAYDGYASQIASKPDISSLATVATSGSYTDLSNKPTIGNATLTIQKNGATINTFTANATSNKTINVTVPTKTSDITNDSNFVADANYVHTDNNFTSALKTKLGGVAAGAEVNVQSDWNVSDSSSDAYIKNKPTIPAAQVQSNWTQTTTTAVDYIKNKPTLATVATSGSYTDLANKPVIPTVNNATLTIQKNGATVGTWTSNASANKTINVTVPTRTSELTNNSGFITGYTETDPIFSASPAATITAQDIEAWTDKSDFSGNYNDLTNKPTIPTVNNATLTIQKNGTTVQTFTANSSSNKVANITVPVITLTNTDPGEGGSLAANNFIGVYI